MIELPDGVVPNSFTMRYLDFGGVQRPALGGAITRVNRLGNRFACDFTLPPLPLETGRMVVSRLIRAKTEGIRIELPLTAGEQGAPGTAVQLSAAATGGISIAVDGLNPYYAAREGYWISLVKSGQHYVHNIAALVTANVSGAATWTITPELRTSFADNSVVNVAAPMIEGLIDGDEQAWEWSLAHHLGIGFTVEEAA